MLRFGGIASLRRKGLVVLPLLTVLAVTTTAAYAGLVSRIRDDRITESSALAVSAKHPGYAYTLNDDEDSHQAIVYTIRISTGAVVGTTVLSGVTPVDPEALSIDRDGRLWYADTGANGLRNDKDNWDTYPPTLYRFVQPSSVSGTRTVSVRRYPLAYPPDKHWDVEALLINPKTDAKHLVTKEPDQKGKRLALPSTLVRDQPNKVLEREKLTDRVSDGSFTPNGKWAVIRSPKKAYVYYASSPWKLHASFDLPSMVQPESLSFDPKGTRFLIGSEGTDSPLYWISFDQTKGKRPS